MPEMSVEGFCTAMCPDYQLQTRTAHANENSLEVVDPLGQGRTIEQLATKKFERNVSCQTCCDILCAYTSFTACFTCSHHCLTGVACDPHRKCATKIRHTRIVCRFVTLNAVVIHA